MGTIGIRCPPGKSVRFVISLHRAVRGCHHKEPDVQMEMFGLARSGGDGMDIQIQRWLNNPQTFNAGLLGRFGQRDLCQVGDAVRMSAWLKPSTQLHMMQDERRSSAGIDHRS